MYVGFYDNDIHTWCGNIFTDDVDYDYFWCGLWLFITWFIIFDVDYDCFYVNYDDLYVYVMYSLSINYSGSYIKNIKPTVQSWQEVNRLKVRLSGAACFEKNLISEDSSFVPGD